MESPRSAAVTRRTPSCATEMVTGLFANKSAESRKPVETRLPLPAQERRHRMAQPSLDLGHRAPRGVLEPCGGGRPPPTACRSRLKEAEGSPTGGTSVKVEAALTTTGRASTVRWRGSGKRDGKVYARNQRRKAPQAQSTSSNLTDKGWVATRTRPVWPVGELLGSFMSPAGRPR